MGGLVLVLVLLGVWCGVVRRDKGRRRRSMGGLVLVLVLLKVRKPRPRQAQRPLHVPFPFLTIASYRPPRASTNVQVPDPSR